MVNHFFLKQLTIELRTVYIVSQNCQATGLPECLTKWLDKNRKLHKRDETMEKQREICNITFCACVLKKIVLRYICNPEGLKQGNGADALKVVRRLSFSSEFTMAMTPVLFSIGDFFFGRDGPA